jgi:bacterioferritin
MLNRAIARELQAAIQYVWQHVQWKGIEHFAVSEELKKIAIGEMKHSEKDRGETLVSGREAYTPT